LYAQIVIGIELVNVVSYQIVKIVGRVDLFVLFASIGSQIVVIAVNILPAELQR